MNRIRHFSAWHAVSLSVGVCLLAAAASFGAWAADTDVSADKPTSMRISASQYRRTIANIFGSSIVITARFEAETRENGLLAIGALNNSVSEDGFERYHEIAKDVAAQVVDKRHRDVLIPCKPKSETAGDEACARKFLAATGRLLFRRPLKKDE